ncbi:hypothetical protein C464_10923 [Halorubrum coriense DSM 10284]|uniref:Glycosyltransferase RgtA/B/C/D-like domain-containing protein n=1 Tax=Halorubrum coriense DSM 10284 TaxID=1227466 RepID=M0EHE4_9EURY|nr:hypothetical protein [Halorubrum coriense]ELZ46322.1 hypothetical protein C464_10923 [Halorubrum coriense DSM 10284]
MRTSIRWGDEQFAEAGLAVGYLALAAAVVASYTAPATGYELSIYAATPAATWAALAVVAVISVTVFLFVERYLAPAVLLGGLGAATVAGLPLIRSYHFYGRSDSLVHLGLARSIGVGNDPLQLFYPGSHLIATGLAKVAAVDVPRAMMLVMWAYTLLFFASVALCVWFLVPDRRALGVGAFSAFLLLPVNNVSTYLHFHTYSIGMLFVPFVLYLVFSHLIGGDGRERLVERVADGRGAIDRAGLGFDDTAAFDVELRRPVPTSYLLPPVLVAIVLVHPQIALNVMFLLSGIAVAQHAFRRFSPNHSLAGYRLVTLQTVFLVVAFAVWIATHEWQFVNTAEAMIESVSDFVTGDGSTTPRVERQGESASSIGASIQELFVKLFGVAAIYSVLAAGVVVGRLTGYLGPLAGGGSMRSTPDTAKDVTALFFAGCLLLFPFFAAHFVGSISTYLFRHVGFLMMLATIFGAVGVRYLLDEESSVSDVDYPWAEPQGRSAGRRIAASLPDAKTMAAVAAVVLVLSLSLATAFPSPFVYLSGSHVPEGEMDGYERAFATQSGGSPVWFGGVRHTSDRYEVALYGAAGAPWDRQVNPSPKKSSPVPAQAMLDGLPAYYENHPEEIVRRDHYFVVAEADRQREVGAYRELRYSAESFEAVAAQPDVGKVRDNGELTIYFVDSGADPSANAADDRERIASGGWRGATGVEPRVRAQSTIPSASIRSQSRFPSSVTP